MADNIPNNLLPTNGFVMTISGVPNTLHWVTHVNLPGLTIGNTLIATSANVDYNVPGDKVVYDDLVITMPVDKDLENWFEMLDWSLNALNTHDDFRDITIHTLTPKKNFNRGIRFTHAYPYMLSQLTLDYAIPPDAPVTVDISFKFAEMIRVSDK